MDTIINFFRDNASWIYYVLAILGIKITLYKLILSKIKESKLNLFISLITEVPASIKNIEKNQSLMYSEIKLQGKVVSAILDTLDLAHFLCNPEGLCIKVNSKWVAITGMPESDALGHNWILSIHPDDRDRVQHKWHEMVEINTPFEEVFRYQNRVTSVITQVKCHATDVLDETGARIFVLGFSRVLH